ncbi:hypothetical protein HWC07_gp108 [Pantoea phage vB_PagM_LIET2]|uniref:Uncharacterized protein n=1 Tax=Pantoea phage vB_PagM_LIET2 TaxID=2508071 RepID=A0A411AWB6_9CAUD|nr:hypothetical protein HWC07_gp108 [Pantoea phage vB_PagM_LIET2]QAX92360.1 hypothetical protein LIET2_gp108 [Pantoea phage vB_PagM_LIET2]
MNRLNELNVGDRVWMVPGDARNKPFQAEVVKKGRKLMGFLQVFAGRNGNPESLGGYPIDADMTVTRLAVPLTRANVGSGYRIYRDAAEFEAHKRANQLKLLIVEQLQYVDKPDLEVVENIAAMLGIELENKDEA